MRDKRMFFLLVVWGGVDPEVVGPFMDEGVRDATAAKMAKPDNAVFKMDCESLPDVRAYPAWALEGRSNG